MIARVFDVKLTKHQIKQKVLIFMW